MSNSKSFFSILVPAVTVFISSGCIMVLELVAGRLVAKDLGSSLYTWTSIIGIVLAGITIGNYIGGRLADRYSPRKTLGTLFCLASVACVKIIILNNVVGQWVFLWQLNWPARVFSHVCIVFLLPSALLGTISPVVAKMALDRGLPAGRTVGDIYAFGAAGSIAGTFLAGFYLIATMGTIAIVWTVACALLLIAFLYWHKLWLIYVWAVLLAVFFFLGNSSKANAETIGSALGLRTEHDPKILYEDETPYCYVAVKQISEAPDRRVFIQDKLKHSEIDMTNLDNLRYFYTLIYASITHGLRPENQPLTAMGMGGGGYVYPQYLEKNWPGSQIDVVEIDPGVTKAAMQAFGLKPDTSIDTYNMDARNFVDDLLYRIKNGEKIASYDFIYEDAINDYSVPYQLVTEEFNNKIAQILKPNGVYMVNLIDVYNSGKFLGSMAETLEKTFPHVHILSEDAPRSIRNTFVIAASFEDIDIESIIGSYQKGADIWHLSKQEIDGLKANANHIVMTDDFVPVENMLAPVVRRSTADILSLKHQENAEEFSANGKFDESIAEYKKMVEVEPTMALLAYNEIAIIMFKQNKLQEAANYFQKAIAYNAQADSKVNIAGIHLNLGLILQKLNQSKQAQEHFQEAIGGFKAELAKDETSLKNTLLIANTLMQMEDFQQATVYFQKAVNLNPYDAQQHIMLAQALEKQGLYNQAISAIEKAIAFFKSKNGEQQAEPLKQYLEMLKFRKAQSIQSN
ncbi:MAG: fused MFS/spermidine synthase [Phycisphaerae bacterium]|nr:fused MFS/spermidine synthase [Phycisphaerae bacterium]